MQDKMKFVVMGLAAILVISLFVNLQSMGSKQSLERERNTLRDANTELSNNVERGIQENKRLQNKLDSLNKDMERVSREKEDLLKKYDLANRERDELISRLKDRPAQAAALAVETPRMTASPSSGTNDTYWGGILKAKTDLELQLDKLRTELKDIQIKNEQLLREKSSLDMDVNNLTRENQELKKQFDYNQKIMDSLTQELVREKNDKFVIQDNLKTVKTENDVLRRQLKSINGRKVNLERRLADLQDKNNSLEAEMSKVQTFVQDKMIKIDNLQKQLEVGPDLSAPERKNAVELPPIVVRPQKESAIDVAKALTGKVLLVNKESNFIIIDLGEDSGIKAGDGFGVYRDGQSIAEVEVIQIRKNISACDIKKESSAIRAGDLVR